MVLVGQQRGMRLIWVTLVLLLTCLMHQSFAQNRYYTVSKHLTPVRRVSSEAIEKVLVGLPTRGRIKQADLRSAYFYLPVDQQYVLRLFSLLQRYLRWSSCVGLPASLHGQAHISLNIQGGLTERQAQVELLHRVEQKNLPMHFSVPTPPLIQRVEVKKYDMHLHHTIDSRWYILPVNPDFSAWNTLVSSSGRYRRALARLRQQPFHISVALERRAFGRCVY